MGCSCPGHTRRHSTVLAPRTGRTAVCQRRCTVFGAGSTIIVAIGIIKFDGGSRGSQRRRRLEGAVACDHARIAPGGGRL